MQVCNLKNNADVPLVPSGEKKVDRSLWAWAFLAAAVSGGLMASGFRPLNWHFLSWFAMVPWLVVLPHLNSRQAWLFGCAMGLVFYRIGLDWLFGIHGPLALIGVFLLAILVGLTFRVARLVMDRFGRGAMLWVVPLAFTGQEVLRSEGLDQLRFAYLGWGYSQADNQWVAQFASLGGVYSLTFVLVAVNAAIAHAIVVRRRSGLIPLASVVFVIAGLTIVAQPSEGDTSGALSVAAIQAEETDYRTYVTLTRQALTDPSKPDFVVLPEHTIAGYADGCHPFVTQLALLAKKYNAYICVGAHTRAKPGSECDFNNVGLLIAPDGTTVGSQSKAVPVPFFDDGNPATSQSAFETRHGLVGIFVCYDGSFTDVPRRVVDAGAELLLVPVMNPDSWPEQQQWQQEDIARFRSIELRRYTIRAASSGVSAIVGAEGNILADRSRGQGPGIVYGSVCFSRDRTLFVRGGHYFSTVVGFAFLLLVIVLTLRQWVSGIYSYFAARRPAQ